MARRLWRRIGVVSESFFGGPHRCVRERESVWQKAATLRPSLSSSSSTGSSALQSEAQKSPSTPSPSLAPASHFTAMSPDFFFLFPPLKNPDAEPSTEEEHLRLVGQRASRSGPLPLCSPLFGDPNPPLCSVACGVVTAAEATRRGSSRSSRRARAGAS